MNIFIAGISYNLSNADLGELFQPKSLWTEKLAVLKDSVL